MKNITTYIVPLTEIKKGTTKWVVPHWIPRGGITLLAGDGGVAGVAEDAPHGARRGGLAAVAQLRQRVDHLEVVEEIVPLYPHGHVQIAHLGHGFIQAVELKGQLARPVRFHDIHCRDLHAALRRLLDEFFSESMRRTCNECCPAFEIFHNYYTSCF